MACSHIHKTIEWGFDRENNHEYYPKKWGCTKCEETWDKLPTYEEEMSTHDHDTYVWGCFACKIGTIQLNTGDAGRADSMPQKKWDKELVAYKEARKQGIQPEGTSKKQIDAAVAASQKLGTAFNAETMGSATKITKSKAKGIKELGVS